jgi:hypothetical protein
MTRHAARRPRADKPLPVQRARAERHADSDRAERLTRLAEVLVDVDDRIAAEDAAAAQTG